MEGSGIGGEGGGATNNNNKDLVDTFCEITSSSKEEANFFLESHNWDLDSAVSTFLEEDHHNNNPNHQLTAPSPQIGIDSSPSPFPSSAASSIPLIPPSNTTTTRSTPDISMSSRDKKSSKQPPKSTGGGRRPGGIRTLSDLNRHSGHDSDSDSDGPQEYYTGGEKSGMIVQDPTKGNDVDSIFDQARQLGAVEGSLDHLRPSSSSTSFTGTGRLLSGETVATPNPQPPEVITHNIVFWSNGFTVDDGPLRRVDDPENAPFLESIRKSECPKELDPADRNSSVHVNLIRREVNRPEPEKQHIPFHGVGRTLGSTSGSNIVVAEPTVAPAPLNVAPTPSMGLVVDDSLPSTSIQLRLADGTRMVARFNIHHTISDIRAFIDASRPGGAISYKLQTVGFPPKQLTDATQTIQQAGLANSVLIQKL